MNDELKNLDKGLEQVENDIKALRDWIKKKKPRSLEDLVRTLEDRIEIDKNKGVNLLSSGCNLRPDTCQVFEGSTIEDWLDFVFQVYQNHVKSLIR
jgi:hypothetical protein